MSYEHTNSKGQTFYLFKLDVTLRNGKVQTIHYFNRNKDGKGTPCELPSDRTVHENPRNGFLTAIKKHTLKKNGMVV